MTKKKEKQKNKDSVPATDKKKPESTIEGMLIKFK